MVEVEQPAKPFAPHDATVSVVVACSDELGGEAAVANTLMISLPVVVLDILADDLSQMPLAQRDHLAQALLLDRSHEALRVSVHIRAASGEPDALHPARQQQLGTSRPKHRVAVV